jgi:hypothetical protein
MKTCREYIVNDSSRFKTNNVFMGRDYSIKIGMVRELTYVETTRETRYIVEVFDRGRLRPLTCSRMTRFGGLFNYEEYNLRGFEPGKESLSYANFSMSPGDTVMVACVNGEPSEGLILGCVKHFGRAETLAADSSISYISEFNGLQTVINKNGEYRVTFKGVPTNISELNKTPDGKPYPTPTYSEEIGSSFYQFSQDGSYLVTDNSTTGAQSIILDKPEGKILVVSGKTTLTIDKKEESYTIINKKTTFNSSDEWNLNTKKTVIKSTNLIQAEAKDIKTTGKWAQSGDMSIKGNIKQTGNCEITGDLKNTGQAMLAGGKYPLIYDIVLIIGVGNAGAPVVSVPTVLKTAMTKAT